MNDGTITAEEMVLMVLVGIFVIVIALFRRYLRSQEHKIEIAGPCPKCAEPAKKVRPFGLIDKFVIHIRQPFFRATCRNGHPWNVDAYEDD